MKVNTFRRFSAYLIDLMVIGMIFMIIYYFLPQNNIQELNHDLTIINEQLLNKQINYNTYIDEFSKITYQIDQEQVLFSGLNILLICFYFIIIPLMNHGKTLGLYILGLKISEDDGHLNMNHLFLRNLITNGLLYMISALLLVHFLDYKTYFISITILGFIQILLVIISIFMILYRKDKKGLQDLISKTKIIREV